MEDSQFNPEEIESLNNSRIEESLKLLDLNGNSVQLNFRALELIKMIEEELIIVTIFGKPKSGKSFLMNLLIDNLNGFRVGNDEKSNPSISIWNSPKSKINSNSKILFIDTDNLLSSNKLNYKIISMLTIISSLFIFNTTSLLDENGIKELEFASQLANSLTSKFDKEAFITESAPKLIFTLRDFKDNKVDSSGKEISSKEYLDNLLRSSKFKNKDSELIRESILKYFHDRDCFTFVKPSDSMEKIHDVQDLSTQFICEFMLLKNKIFNEVNSKKLRGKKFNGANLAVLIEEWVNSINLAGSNLPNVNNIWDTLINKDISAHYQKALEIYNLKINNLSGVVQEQEDLIKALYLLKLEALTNYNKIYNFNQDTFNNSQYLAWYNENKRQLESEISSKQANLLEANKNLSEIMCQNLLEEEYQTIKNRVEKNYYSSKTCDEYLRDHEAFLNSYVQNSKGPNKVKKLVEFLSVRKPEFMTTFIKNLEEENTGKLKEMNEFYQQTEKKKKEAEERNKELNDTAQINNEKINDLNSELEKKKREIIDLSKRVESIEMDIRNRREEMQKSQNLNIKK